MAALMVTMMAGWWVEKLADWLVAPKELKMADEMVQLTVDNWEWC